MTSLPHQGGEVKMTDEESWAELFPAGRRIFYEGDDPRTFADEIKNQIWF
jgi:hypothetical protein